MFGSVSIVPVITLSAAPSHAYDVCNVYAAPDGETVCDAARSAASQVCLSASRAAGPRSHSGVGSRRRATQIVRSEHSGAAERGRGEAGRSCIPMTAQALPVFSTPPPTGVGVKTRLGMRYVQYSFASAANEEVINAFLQTLIGLDDYAQASGDPVAQRLFAAGDAEAEAELPHFNTGAWSLYQPGLEDDLSYHQLVTGFLQQLCSMTKTTIYCSTAAAFQLDLKTPPALKLVTTRVKANKPTDVYFTVSKISRVGGKPWAADLVRALQQGNRVPSRPACRAKQDGTA
jgi:hypothetical protein